MVNQKKKKQQTPPYGKGVASIMFAPPLLLSILASLLKMLGGGW